MSVVFLGTSEFAAAVLRRLVQSGVHRPALVLTRPDRPRGRGRRLAAPPVADAARELELPLAQPEQVNDPQARAVIAQAGAGTPQDQSAGETGGRQTVVVCAFGALIKEPLLSEHEMLNVHPSLLPRWRGAAPIERALMAGDDRSGVSIMRLTAGLDSGPVCLAAGEPIRPDDTYATLAARLQQLGGELVLAVLDRKARGEPPAFSEQDEVQATYAEKILAADRLLEPGRPAQQLERVVRALHPHIGAHVSLQDGTLLGVHRAVLLDAPATGSAGLAVEDGRLLLQCTPGVLELLVVQPSGRRPMDARTYLRGHPAPGRR